MHCRAYNNYRSCYHNVFMQAEPVTDWLLDDRSWSVVSSTEPICCGQALIFGRWSKNHFFCTVITVRMSQWLQLTPRTSAEKTPTGTELHMTGTEMGDSHISRTNCILQWLKCLIHENIYSHVNKWYLVRWYWISAHTTLETCKRWA